ncbi:MAG: MptD family putative ECF transporter S component [Streptococcaceae bacterium]|jgi:energy-coupling factor transport system substrate-specific component|nr:MptD family putative ECF transporter S component [Streptococcaceae bacterium]MCH4176432.1 MptD family putative ECF transporter S component [Streptococcaceae bacterium]
MGQQKLNVKDLINIGLFTALYFICYFTAGMTGFIPVMMLLLPFLIGLVGGIPIMLFLTKVPKFGALSIMGIIVLLLMFFMGHPWMILAFGIPVVLFGDWIASRGNYKQWHLLVAGYTIFSLWPIGAMYPLIFMKETYLKSLEGGYGTEYTNALDNLFSGAVVPFIVIGGILGSILGAYLGRAVLKKHFKRAGIAQ